MEVITIYLILLICIWTVNPFLKKISSEKIGFNEFLLLSAVVYLVLILIYYIYDCRINNRKVNFNNISNLSKKDLTVAILVNISWVVGVLLFLKLINSSEISYLIPQVQCIIIALTFIIGYLVFNESFSIHKAIGIFFIIFGILFINMKNKDK
tara:strand:- start:48 stop:506 length:459 start_codon:yes stop_codon:yes gene_type:complete